MALLTPVKRTQAKWTQDEEASLEEDSSEEDNWASQASKDLYIILSRSFLEQGSMQGIPITLMISLFCTFTQADGMQRAMFNVVDSKG